MEKRKIAVAGTGYVGLSIATLLSQKHQVTAVDIVPEKVEMINNRKSPIQDEYIEKYLTEKKLNLTATLDAEAAYSDADFVVIAAPTNYDSRTQHFDTSAVVKVEPDTLKDAVLSNSPSVKAHIGFCSGAVRIVLTAVFINSFATASAVSPA